MERRFGIARRCDSGALHREAHGERPGASQDPGDDTFLSTLTGNQQRYQACGGEYCRRPPERRAEPVPQRHGHARHFGGLTLHHIGGGEFSGAAEDSVRAGDAGSLRILVQQIENRRGRRHSRCSKQYGQGLAGGLPNRNGGVRHQNARVGREAEPEQA